ncbi:asparagine synthase (glutamine-hydrolyzing) [Roseisolibacter sp. H3M3-2]|uniref:asparagine synthase (glutamine-hydrolyzing) n=1 Tax=Roseisolibacter sp. H3M3-2 TaxID=3031323 RepID=UPI0023D9EEAA|nr:asparagine synthase (glutamine-hydrolyzing) [Roseisolibacter sp. H3M3-2]MDF1502348.1 asparagine synthase (glutamine-hydrolyzing) [Roseisolibacter sp. H3M3-2]
MCGISGAVSTRADADLEALVGAIVRDQDARGPDAQSVQAFDGGGAAVVLGHNRLSIIDVRPEANQPMRAGDRVLVFNGEVYNFLELRAELEAGGVRFETRSDTEVVLAAYRRWGADAFGRFIGMFALALYDSAARELVLVRDRFGVKPLYHWTDGSTFAFASTPSVIARWAGLAPDLDYVARGIRFKYYEDDGSTAPYVGLSALEPSHLLRVRWADGRVRVEKSRYYDVAAAAEARVDELARRSVGELEEELLTLLRSAVRLRQRSDVPLGLSVSGGVDSSSIAALLSEELPRVIGYTYGRPDAADSEGPMVATLAGATHLEPHYVWVDDPRDVSELFWRTLRAQGAPFPHASMMAQHAVFRAARADGTIVLLGGQGGDEAFMGYRKFYLFYAQSIVRERRVGALPHFLRAVVPFAPAVLRRAGVFLAERGRYTGAAQGMGTRLVLPPADGAHMGLAPGAGTRERQRLDVTRFSLPTLLRYEDRNSMGNSIESRLPFLDHRVIEFGLALQERVKLRDGFGKWILREAMRGRLPDAIRVNRDKRGFDVNQERWIRGGLGAELRTALRERRAAVGHLLPAGESTDALFSDDALVQHPQAFKEAVSLLWLGGHA